MSTSTTPIPVAGGVSGTFEIGAARRTVALVGLLLSMLMANIDASIVNVALPQLAGDLHVTAGNAVWVATAFLLAVACCLPLAIGLADQLGRKRLFMIGTPVFTLASLLCALSPSLEALVASRVLQGAAASLLFAVVIPTYRQLFPPARLGSILGLNAMIVALGISAGPALGGVILANLSWPWLFLINVPIGALASVLVLVALPHTPPSRGAFDLVGALTGGAAIACFLLGVHQLADDSTVWLAGILLAGCAGFVTLFLRHEKHAAAPVLPPSMFSGRFVLAVLAAFWSFFGQGVAFVALPFLFQTAYHATPLESALLFTPWPLVIVIVAPIAGRVADSFSPTLMATIGLALFTLGLLSLALLGDHPPIWQVLLCTAFTGFGFAVFQAPNNRDMMDAATPRMSGPAAGMLNINRTIAQSAGAGAVSMALVLTGATTLADQASASSGVLWVAVIGAGLAAVLAFWRLRRAPAAR